MNSHQQQELYFDQVGSRSPGSFRQPHQTLNRHTSRQAMDTYNGLASSSFLADEQSAALGSNRFDRMNMNMQNGGVQGGNEFYNMGGAQSWNPNAFAASGNLGGANSFAFGTIGARMKPTVRGRANLPNTWLEQQQPQMQQSQVQHQMQSQINSLGAFGGLGVDNTQLRSNNYLPEPDDDLIPTAIVIKNIPFAVKKEQLTDVMAELNLPLPYAFNYHFDSGVFRGLAFANYTSPEETAHVISVLNHYELQGRKLRVEYKKMLPLQERERIEREKRERRGQLEEQHRPPLDPRTSLSNQHSMSSMSSHINNASPSPISQGTPKPIDLNDPQVLQFYNQVFSFKEDPSREALIFPTGLSASQRRIVHTLAHNLNLYHHSRGQGDQRQVHVTRTPQTNNISPPMPQSGFSTFHTDPSRRTLNRAATTDFSESRGQDNIMYSGTLRSQQSGPFLGIPDSPGGYQTRDNLRAAKSFADLRSYTPSPVPSTASFPANLQSNATRMQELAASSGVQGSSLTSLGSGSDDHHFVNGFSNLSVGTNIASATNRSSPRALRSVFSFENPSTAPIGSNRTFPLNNHNDASRERNSTMPIRQPSIPSDRGGSAFSRNRQNGHHQRNSDEARPQHGTILE